MTTFATPAVPSVRLRRGSAGRIARAAKNTGPNSVEMRNQRLRTRSPNSRRTTARSFGS
jgi:hypothetical protein